ncbi:DUF3050 domain-containing protein [Bacillus taeanensis]|uniref:Antimetabolite toxin biosynthesis protein MgoB n=1 Tax=Bacillus taeanensis TaxID=273032 RepID=A0A366XYU4_9BACI|nr:DUF3050 domain-containing protein [Bacillus taeanensis]RBW70738.1 antimetabolite toxin biosynthesis protein MgoB [Bacillus taeanensis]
MTDISLKELETIREDLLHHPIYKKMNSADRIKLLMKHHVFAVWDFMSLLKRLQQSLTTVTVPWVPQPYPEYARFINEIVLGEETDKDGEGSYISHFELYLKSMEEVGADSQPIRGFIERLQSGMDPITALQSDDIPHSAAEFVTHSLSIAMNGKIHEAAAAFFFGREDLIPDMFQLLIDEVKEKNINAKWLTYFLQRHIELDGDEHGPLAEKLLISLCENDPVKIKEAEATAKEALQARIKLWDGVLQELKEKNL